MSRAERDPYTLHDDPDDGAEREYRAFWADEIADRIEERDPEDPIVIKGGVSPSGIPHIGHVNEILRGYFVAEVLRERGHEVRQLFTSDDKDRFRRVPRVLANLDWELVELSETEVMRLQEHLGEPYTDIPDPFECCDSYGAHFTRLLAESADLLGVPVEFVSNTERYADGTFEPVTRELLANQETAREVLAEYQNKVDDEYVPFHPQCENCGKITENVTDVDLDAGIVSYECVDQELGNNPIEGCGHEGTATLREGKLPWRFEWPAQWKALGVDFEPFGKDHAAGSWPSGEDIARNVLGFEPPVPMVYEWFTVDGKPLSSSSGDVLTAAELLEVLEPEVVRFFFTKNPNKARDLSVERLDQLVDEFDRFEAVYFGEADADEAERRLAERVYPFVVDEPRKERVRIPYSFAALIGMTDDPTVRRDILVRSRHVTDQTPAWAIEDALDRVERARAWAERVDNEYNVTVKEQLPDVAFDEATLAAFDDLAEFVAAGHGADEIQGEIYESAKRHDVGVGDFFSAGYRLFLDEDQGPKLGPFLAALDREFVLARLRREG